MNKPIPEYPKEKKTIETRKAKSHCKVCLANIYNDLGICYECKEDEIGLY